MFNKTRRPSAGSLTNALESLRVIGLLNSIEVFGQERANIEVFKALRRQGARVVVGINQKEGGGPLRKYVEDLGFEVFSVPFGCQWSKKFFYDHPSLVPKNFWKVCRCSELIRKQVSRLDATHIHLGNGLAYSFIAPYLAWNRKISVVYRMGDIPPYDSKPNFVIWKACVRRANKLIVNSEFVRHEIARHFPTSRKAVGLIYNLAPGDGEKTSRERAKVDTSKPLRVLYVGQISQHKGIHHFVACAIELASRDPRWQFDIVGGSMYSRSMEDAIRSQIASSGKESQITMHGSVRNPDKFYENALVTVVPSLCEEAAANVVLEAKRFGVPTIVYPSGGLPELVSHGKTGWVCEEKTVGVLRRWLEHCLTNPESCVAKQNACLREYAERFSQERFDQEWSRVYRGSLSGRDGVVMDSLPRVATEN